MAFGPNELVRRRGCGWLGELVQQLVYPLKVHMIRDSIPRLIEVRELVPGDVIMVEEGDRLSADARLLTGSVEMDVSMLTAESLPVLREADPFDTHGPILEALDMVFSGTNYTEGDATAVVFGPRRLWARLGASSRRPGTREPLVWVRDECCKVMFCADDLVDKTSTSGLAASSSGPGDCGGIPWRRSPERAGWSEVGSVITDYLSQPVQGSSHASRPLVAEPGECRSHQ